MKRVAVLHLDQFNQAGNTTGFYASSLQNHLLTAHKDIVHPHSHDFYLAILFTQGSGAHEVDFTTYTITPGDLFLMNPGQTHHWELSEDVEGYVLFHTKSFYDLEYTRKSIQDYPFFYSIHNTPVVHLNVAQLEYTIMLFDHILEENLGRFMLKADKLRNLTDLIYIEATRAYIEQNTIPESNGNSYYSKFREFEALVEHHFREEKSPAAYAAMLNISPKHLNRIVQAIVAKSSGEAITERVLLEAKKMLVLQKKHFSEIAYALGYDDYAYFSRLFKNKTGETPSGFLQRYQN